MDEKGHFPFKNRALSPFVQKVGGHAALVGLCLVSANFRSNQFIMSVYSVQAAAIDFIKFKWRNNETRPTAISGISSDPIFFPHSNRSENHHNYMHCKFKGLKQPQN
jgi:hypothetical protein